MFCRGTIVALIMRAIISPIPAAPSPALGTCVCAAVPEGLPAAPPIMAPSALPIICEAKAPASRSCSALGVLPSSPIGTATGSANEKPDIPGGI